MEGTTGAGLGWRRGRGLRFGCLTQKRLECKELIHSGVSLPQTKGQASRQRLREGERRVRDEGGWWLSYHLELLFWGEAGGWWRGSLLGGGGQGTPPSPHQQPTPGPHPQRVTVHVLRGPDRRPSARSYYTGALPCSAWLIISRLSNCSLAHTHTHTHTHTHARSSPTLCWNISIQSEHKLRALSFPCYSLSHSLSHAHTTHTTHTHWANLPEPSYWFGQRREQT